jgi:hypothetical protein
MVQGKSLELAKTKRGWAYGTVLPLAQCAGLMGQITAALDGL